MLYACTGQYKKLGSQNPSILESLVLKGHEPLSMPFCKRSLSLQECVAVASLLGATATEWSVGAYFEKMEVAGL